MPFYEYKHPKTGEIFEDLRTISNRDCPYISEDGEVCERVIFTSQNLIDKNLEPYQYDGDYWRKVRPKHVVLRNGKKVKYDPNTMF